MARHIQNETLPSAPVEIRGASLGVSDLAGLMDLLAREADVLDGQHVASCDMLP